MEFFKFTSCKADADVWMRPVTKADSTSEYYDYVLFYADNCLVVSKTQKEYVNKN